jgi:hypothetical protein
MIMQLRCLPATAYEHALGGMITFSKASEPPYWALAASWQPPLRQKTLTTLSLSSLPSSPGLQSALNHSWVL